MIVFGQLFLVVFSAIFVPHLTAQNLIHPRELVAGGPSKGGIGVDRGIAAIAQPQFETIVQASQWLTDKDIVFGIKYEGWARAYPKKVMVWHEIVNDVFGVLPVLVTYCPLCGTGIAFKRLVKGKSTRFGTSGKLYKSNLVMYDELTDSLWTQIDGRAVIGDMAGAQLELISMQTYTFKDWKKKYPLSQVLSRNTGFKRKYGRDPYGRYYQSRSLMFGASHTDTRLHPKQMVAGILINKTSKAYSVKAVHEQRVINDMVQGVPLLVTKNPNDSIGKGFELNPVKIFDRRAGGNVLTFKFVKNTLRDTQTKSVWSFNGECVGGKLKGQKLKRVAYQSSMWFAWLKFHPDTQVVV